MRPATIVYCATSLDGFIAREDGGIDWLHDGDDHDPNEDYGWVEFFEPVDHIVMGRATFELVLNFDVWHYGDTPLTVLSTTMKEVPEKYRGKVDVLSLAPAALLQALGDLGRRRVYVDGGRTVQSFLREDLVDELAVTRIPVLIGRGIPLFGELGGDLHWEHVSTKVYPKGLVKSWYKRKR